MFSKLENKALTADVRSLLSAGVQGRLSASSDFAISKRHLKETML
jgi:hypothetical protein